MVENGRKWQAIDFHGYLVGNGFPRIIRHSPTTSYNCFWLSSFTSFLKASLVIFTGFANTFYVNMELIRVILVDLVIVIQLGICNDG